MRQEQIRAPEMHRVRQVLAETSKALGDVLAVATYCRVYRWPVLFLAFLAPLATIPSLVTPWLAQLVIDKAYPARDYRLLVWAGAGLLSLRVSSAVLTLVSGYLSTHIANRLQYRLSFRVLRALQRLPLWYRETHGAGGLLVRADRDVQAVAQSVTQWLPRISTLLFTFLAAVALMLRLSAGVTLVILAVVPLNYWIVGRLTGKLMSINRAALAITDQVTTFVGETIEGAVIAKLFSLNRLRRRKFRKLLRERLRLSFAAWQAQARWGQLAGLVMGGWGAAVLGAGWYLVFSDRLNLGQAVALGMYIGVLTRPFEQLGTLYRTLLMDSVAAGRVLEILRGEPTPTPTGPPRSVHTPPRRYEFRGLSFGYQQGRLCLHDINLNLQGGQTVVVVGPTGGGKSTLLRILCGLDDRYTGQFLVDGHDFRGIDRHSYLHHVSWVPQTHFFFSDSIRDNLDPHDGSPTTNRLRRYAAALGLDSVIDAIPEGYEARLGDRGTRLSVGQYQKLAALRATLKDAPVLLLDEVAASMDIESERTLLQGIMALRPPGGLTVLVTHHIAITVEPWIDDIVVLVNGRIAEQGSSVQLRERGGFYHHWLRLSRGTSPDNETPLCRTQMT